MDLINTYFVFPKTLTEAAIRLAHVTKTALERGRVDDVHYAGFWVSLEQGRLTDSAVGKSFEQNALDLLSNASK